MARRSIPREKVRTAVRHLKRSDPVMEHLIRRVGPFTLQLETDRFHMLVRSILSQQISTKAARAIRARLEERLEPDGVTPENLLAIDVGGYRELGISGQKARYLHDLSAHVREDRLQLRTIGRRPDEAVIEQLVQVKGIGRWTAQMFLMFALGRLDVLPHDDLGIRAAIRRLYDLSELPDRHEMDEIAEPWRPYASVAVWYCWRSGDLTQDSPEWEDGYPV